MTTKVFFVLGTPTFTVDTLQIGFVSTDVIKYILVISQEFLRVLPKKFLQLCSLGLVDD
jgi:hypothetical protein